MATPPDSSGLFLSSSPARFPPGPSEDVEARLAQAREVENVDPVINNIIATDRKAFFDTFSRRISLIKSRSQDFHDCQVTVFDKVLLDLTQDGDDMDHPAAIQFFAEEFLAVLPNASPGQKVAALSNETRTSGPVIPVISPPQTQRVSVSDRDGRDVSIRSPHKKTLFGHELDVAKSVDLSQLAAKVGQNMPRLWSVYDQAKKEFYAIADTNSIEKQSTAKFLRDTAENTLQYLQSKNADQRLLDEVATNLEVAKYTAMTLHGGKKRKFDQPASNEAIEWAPPTRIAQPDLFDGRHLGSRFDRESRAQSNSMRRGFSGHARALAQHRSSEEFRDISHGRQSKALELFPAPQASKRRRTQHPTRSQPGRGHSNIPFGYSRAVDSYQPEG